MQAETGKKGSFRNTYKEHEAFTEKMLKIALDERKMLAIDRHNLQIGHIRQSLYLSITLAGAVCAVAACTPYFNSKPVFSDAALWQVLMLGAALTLCIGAFLYGAYSLRGEIDGRVPKLDFMCPGVENFVDIVNWTHHPDGSGQADEMQGVFLSHVTMIVQEHYQMMEMKARKIRNLNAIVLAAASVAAIATLSLFSTSLYGKVYGNQGIEVSIPRQTCAETVGHPTTPPEEDLWRFADSADQPN